MIDNTYSESLALEARKSIAATGKLVNFGKDIYKSRGSDFNILSSNLIQTRVERTGIDNSLDSLRDTFDLPTPLGPINAIFIERPELNGL